MFSLYKGYSSVMITTLRSTQLLVDRNMCTLSSVTLSLYIKKPWTQGTNAAVGIRKQDFGSEMHVRRLNININASVFLCL